MIRLRDALQRDIVLSKPPRRVVSLVPSDTLSVVALGAGDRLVGRTDYCVEPLDALGQVPTLGGTKNPRIDDVLALSPDLVLVNQEENSRRDVERLIAEKVQVYVAFPRRVAEGVAHLAALARLLDVHEQPAARELVRRGYHALREAEQARASLTPVRVFCPIWMDPLMTIHGDTYLSDMLDLAGAENVFNDRPRRFPLAADLGRLEPLPEHQVAGRDTRYPRVSLDEVIQRAPEVILLPDEPHPFSAQDADVFRALPLPAARHGLIVPCDGRDLTWYGARSVEGLARVKKFVDGLRARVNASTAPS